LTFNVGADYLCKIAIGNRMATVANGNVIENEKEKERAALRKCQNI
jgi:hypothetical protein